MFQSFKGFFNHSEKSVDSNTNLKPKDDKKSSEENTNPSDVLTYAKDLSSKFYRHFIQSSENAVQSIATGSAVKDFEASLRTVVEKVPFLREFQNLQDSFAAERAAEISDDDFSKQPITLPWDSDSVGVSDPVLLSKLQTRILELSKHENTFLLSPPDETHVDDDVFRSPENVLLAKMLLDHDPNLSQMRYKLVPTRIRERCFWRNYFYRLSLVRQSFQLSTLTDSSNDDFVCVDGEAPIKSCPEPNSQEIPVVCSKDDAPAISSSKLSSEPNPAKHDSGEFVESSSSQTISRNNVLIETDAATPLSEETSSPECLTADQLLEAELAREVNDMVLIDSEDEERLERELEEELAQLSPSAPA